MPVLAHQRVALEGAPEPTRWIYFLHGIFGMGTNFRGVAKSLVARAPGWGFVLVDLRGHGASQGFAPPHDLASAAADVEALSREIGLEIAGVAGHSFGGKVLLELLRRRSQPVDVAMVLDSMPGARVAPDQRGDALKVLASLEAIAEPIISREAFRERLLGEGYSTAIVDWLAMNVRPDAGAYRLRLDLPAIRSLLADYFAKDLWGVVESPAAARAMSVIVGGRSDAFGAEARERLARAGQENENLRVHVLEQAGHWVHVDDPSGLLAAMSATMLEPRSGARS